MNKKVSPRRLKGFQDYSPEVMAKRLHIMSKAREIAGRAGFQEVGTPALEYAEVLLGVGGETDKQVFRFMDGGERDVALRYDLTVPFARYASENYGKLPLPFKRLQIGEVWRAEKPQKGRYREFAQCDIDIIGVDSLSADLEILVTVQGILSQVIGGAFTISCNHREILSYLIRKFLDVGDEETEQKVLIVLDKLDKIGVKGIIELLTKDLNIDSKKSAALLEVLSGFDVENSSKLTKHFEDSEILKVWERFEKTIRIASRFSGENANIKIDLSIARGLAYYTGIVFETTVDGVKGFGSVCSGGRYNNLAERFTKYEMPGVGISIGVDRLTALLLDEEDKATKVPAGVFIAVADKTSVETAFEIAVMLRSGGISVDVVLKDQKLGAQFKNADKRGYASVITVGSEEIKTGLFSIKNMKTGDEKKVKKLELASSL